MNPLKKLYRRPVVKATLERMWRGSVSALGGAIALGQISVDGILNGHDLNTTAHVVAGGALTALLLALGISKITKTGPALNKAEQITKKRS